MVEIEGDSSEVDFALHDDVRFLCSNMTGKSTTQRHVGFRGLDFVCEFICYTLHPLREKERVAISNFQFKTRPNTPPPAERRLLEIIKENEAILELFYLFINLIQLKRQQMAA